MRNMGFDNDATAQDHMLMKFFLEWELGFAWKLPQIYNQDEKESSVLSESYWNPIWQVSVIRRVG